MNNLIHGGSLSINFGTAAQICSMIIFIIDKKILDEAHPVKTLIKCLCLLDDKLLEKEYLQTPL